MNGLSLLAPYDTVRYPSIRRHTSVNGRSKNGFAIDCSLTPVYYAA